MAVHVRAAEQGDILRILDLLTEFSNTMEVGKKHFYAPAVAGLIKYATVNGCCLVAVRTFEGGEEIIGTILGAISVNPWTRNSREMREIAWWVNPEHRNTPAGFELYKRYVELSEEMIEGKLISASFMTTLETTGKLIEGLVSQNFKKTETHYIMGG